MVLKEHRYLEMVKNNFVQQYSKKVTHLSQQGYGKKKVQRRKNTSRKNTKKKRKKSQNQTKMAFKTYLNEKAV